MNIDQITEIAERLEITLTNAEDGTEMYKCWADRVEAAWNAWCDDRIEYCQELIEEANRYAI